MKFIWAVVLIMSSVFCGAAHAASNIEKRDLGNGVSLKINKTNKTIAMLSGQQTVFIADIAANRIYQFDAAGVMVSDSSLSAQILLQAGNNPEAAEKITDSFNRMVYSMPPRTISTQPYDPYPCMMSPCPYGYTPPSNPWHQPPFGTSPNSPEFDPLADPSSELLAYDEQQFNRQREERCEDGNSFGSLSLWVATEVAFVASCLATPFTLFAAAGCASGFIAATYTANEIDQARADCDETYPGFGNW